MAAECGSTCTATPPVEEPATRCAHTGVPAASTFAAAVPPVVLSALVFALALPDFPVATWGAATVPEDADSDATPEDAAGHAVPLGCATGGTGSLRGSWVVSLPRS